MSGGGRPSAFALLLALALGALPALAGCGREGEKGTAAKPEGVGAPANGDRLILGTPVDVDGLNPVIATTLTASDVHDLLFWPLAQFNPDFLTFRPGLADSWEFSPDSSSITFRLNPGAAWHDGHPLRAEDVVFANGLCKDERVAWSAIRWMDRIREVTAVDSLTVRFEFSERYPYQLMDAVVCRPLPRHVLGDLDPAKLATHPFNSDPVGNGPFRFRSWTPQQSVEIVANERFFRGRPYLDGIVWRIVPEWTALLTQLKNGEIDFVPAVLPSYYPEVKDDPDLRIYSAPGRRYVYVAWNLRDPLFADRNVRRALTMAIDRQQIIDALLYGQGRVMNSPFVSALWAHDPDVRPTPYDPAGAKRLLEEAGWRDTDGDGVLDKDGRPFRFELVTNADNTLRTDITVAIQSQLERLGIDARPRGLEFVVFQGNLQKKDFQAAVAGWNSQIKVDLTDLWHSKAIEDKFNFISYANAEVDSLNDAAIATFDPGRAKELWSRAQQVIAADAGYTHLFEQYDIHALDERFQGMEMNAGGWGYNVEKWYVPEDRQKY